MALWVDLQEYKNAIRNAQYIGNIYEVLGDRDKMLENYRNALEMAEQTKDFPSKIKLIKRIVKMQTKMGLYAQTAMDLQHIITDLGESTFIDLVSMGNFHHQLADTLWLLDQKEDAVGEYLSALNLYAKLAIPTPDQIPATERLIEYYQGKHEGDRVQFYQDQLGRVKTKIGEKATPSRRSTRLLGEVKEVWIFVETGVEIFNYAPETQLDPELLGGFLSALQSFSLELSKQTLNAMMIGDDRYVFLRRQEAKFYILGRASLKSNETKIEKTLKFIADRFEKEYKPHLVNFAGNVVPFRSFMEILEHIDFDTI